MRTKEFRHYRRMGGAIWKNGEYLIEGRIDENGRTIFQFWTSMHGEVIGAAETLDEAIDDCADHKKGQKVMKFTETETESPRRPNSELPSPQEMRGIFKEENPFEAKEQSV